MTTTPYENARSTRITSALVRTRPAITVAAAFLLMLAILAMLLYT